MPLRVASIPASLPFLDTLAASLPALLGTEAADADPLGATRATLLLPTRRAARAMQDALLRQSGGKAILLPRIVPLGDVAEDEALFHDSLSGPAATSLAGLPTPVTDVERLCLLARLIMARDAAISPAQALALGSELARLIDQAHTEGASLDALASLVDRKPEFSEHWQKTLDFLDVITTVWPGILSARGCVDPSLHRNLVLRAQAEAWTRFPPDTPVIAAGSTGSIPAAADLMRVVAGLPRGLVLLPGLDRTMDDDSWAALEDTHPQAGLKGLLARFGVERQEVRDFPSPTGSWSLSAPPSPCPPASASPAPPSPASARAREAFVSHAFRPARTTDVWRSLEPDSLHGALDGVTLIEAPGQREEAAAIALVMREVLETEGRTAALITPDRTLGRRVAAALDRWSVTIDDSAGTPLGNTAPGLYLRLGARAVASGLAPVALLAFLEHPLSALGEAPGRFRTRIRRLNRDVLRGPRPAPGPAGLEAAIGALGDPRTRTSLQSWLERFTDACGPFLSLFQTPRAEGKALLDAHVAFAEAMAAARIDGEPVAGADRLWAGEAGETAAPLLADLSAALESLGPIRPAHYPALLDFFLSSAVVRPRRDVHPNLAIWGPLEARLQRPDVLILGGLNEGTWPSFPDTGPWLSRPMLASLGLPQPERATGLSAHDVSQALHAPEVILSRSRRVEGSPCLPSRWWVRLETTARAAGLAEAFEDARRRGTVWLDLARQLEIPQGPPRRTGQPHPCPPVAARPRKLPATRIETWMRDPYAIYARYILGLDELDPLEADPSRATYGSLVHAILEDFVTECRHALPENPEARLLELGRARFQDPALPPGVRAIWEPRFCSIAAWFADQERERAPKVTVRLAEQAGQISIEGPAGPFTLSAIADRIDVMRDGTLEIIDYKTGTPPSTREVWAGYAPQLALEAAIALAGGFGTVGTVPGISDLAFWHLRGGRRPGEVRRPLTLDRKTKTPADLATEALEGVRGLVAAFDNPDTPYIARPHPGYAPRFNAYQHLARVAEWASDEDGETGDGD
ncbi:double-strand break repair protein AddB [Phaeovibrio sulfidiphilus]|uniref:Double-strand break repair protein AddB n=1 Tax=Phaeovibrio sulfidiphilus TaxID=1220600 RepID=A0A8J7CW16_9PROT|nr:double-strand break repair protein AddB [Phaeovibrio sulfidiphilus]MBE1236991.1 double-strand break repair protein AddB [Phaeovibrio sulfidiphilus]